MKKRQAVVLSSSWLLVWGVLGVSAVSQDAAAQEREATFQYTVQRGDTCQGLAERFYGTKDAWAKVHQHNALGPMPHHLQAGTVLTLPLAAGSNPDAKLTELRGTVQARPPAERDWQRAQRGLDLYRAWRVNSLERSTAEITFRDTTALQMRENTIVIIYGATSTRARRQTMEAELQSGALRTRLGELAGGAAPKGSGEPAISLIISTASSLTTLDDTAALVEAEPDGTARVANHRGASATVAGRTKKGGGAGRAVTVQAGYGTRVKPASEPEPPRPLPPAPQWASSDPAGFVTLGEQGTIRGSWSPVAQAARYRVEVATEPNGRGLLEAVEVPSSVTSFEVQGVPPGSYFVSVSAVDGDKFEGPPSEVRTKQLIRVAPRGAEATGGAWRQGMVLEVPEGVRCALGGEEPTRRLVLREAAAGELRCVDAAGVALAPQPVTVEASPAAVRLSPPDSAGGPVEVLVSVASPHLYGVTPAVEAPAGFAVGPVEEAGPGRWRSVLTPGDAPSSGEVKAVFAVGSERLTLGQATWEVSESSSSPPEASSWSLLQVGAGFGYGVVVSDGAYGEDVVESGPRLGLGLTLHPLQGFGLGLEGSFARPEVVGQEARTLVAGRGWARYRFGEGLVRPLAQAGGGVDWLQGGDGLTPIVSLGVGAEVQGDAPVGVTLLLLQHAALRDGLDAGTTELRLGIYFDMF